MSQYLAPTHYLPHASPMMMLGCVHDVTDEYCLCSVVVSSESVLAPFLNEDGTLANWFGIELMAQAIGVWNGYHSYNTDFQPKLGMLLGGRGFKANLTTYPANSELFIHAHLFLQDGKLANFECQIKINDQIVAQGKLNVYEPDENESKMLFGDNQ